MAGVRLAFFKLNVADIDPALRFWSEAFGFTVTQTFDEPDFIEHMLALPGQEQGPNLLLVSTRAKADTSVGPGHGPVGLFCDDIDSAHARAIAAGAEEIAGIFATAGVRLSLLRAPQGHEIELVQLPPS